MWTDYVSMMLGNAEMLSEMRDEFCGRVRLSSSTVKILSQEAKELVAKGIMDDADAIVGLHVLPDEDPEEYGKVCFRSDR